MTQYIISLAIVATLHEVVFCSSNKREVVVVVIIVFLRAILGKFLGNEMLSEGSGRIIRKNTVGRTSVGLGNGLIFRLPVALIIFHSKRSTACVAHETITIPTHALFFSLSSSQLLHLVSSSVPSSMTPHRYED